MIQTTMAMLYPLAILHADKGRCNMELLLSALYFVGLVMFGAAVGTHTSEAAYGCMIIGGGVILYAALIGIILFLHK
jgi:hypothetical protein